MQTKQQASLPTDRGHGRYTAAFSRYLRLRRLAARGPRFPQKGRQGYVRLVLKIQNTPIFLDRFADFRHVLAQPFLPGLLARFVVFAFGLLIGKPGFTQPPPNRVLGNPGAESLTNHPMQSPHRPQIRFVTKIRRRTKHQLAPIVHTQILKFARATAARLPLQALLASLPITANPTENRGAIRAECVGDIGHRPPSQNRVHRTTTNCASRISFLIHDEEIISLLAV